ncbi:PUA domain containing protein [Ignicoccus islandicus DSM 13165]|uniref:PUA domain containing protein n=1 Tax=Ignicoccus islandicus DSM 13165 TaxID=940295 RepID=A0A0U3E8I8_9CREN|nr:PUA domain-containing protein [Ignicoccus islandicus]ALU11678.1 PUA domain containing protein [Ignicoccus islandicus DSM 13165]
MRIIKKPLSKREKKQLIKEIPRELIEVDLNEKIEEAKVVSDRSGKEYLVIYINDKPTLARIKNKFIPILCGQKLEFRGVVVDEGAVKHITNGADVMRPGIVEVKGEFDKGDLVLVYSVNLPFPIAVGEALYSSEEIKKMEKGKVIKNIHHLGDELFKLCKGLA